MWCIIIQTAAGLMIREVVEEKPNNSDLTYWEKYYVDKHNFCSDRKATVVNVFEIAGDAE